MSDHLHFFRSSSETTAVALPFELAGFIRGWDGLRAQMIKEMPVEFSRDEWAYLISFLDAHHLHSVFEQSFGTSQEHMDQPVQILLRPRGGVAIWLPNNVSLLGPLTLILMSLTGNPLSLKGGSQSEDLAGAFLHFARKHASGALQAYLQEQVNHLVFERDDPKNRAMAAEAMVRIVFGSDAAAEAIHAFPHPLESVGFSFVDRRSEAWLEKGGFQGDSLADLLKVFAIYGQAGCTSPRRVVLLGGNPEEALGLRDRLIEMWPQVIKRPPAPHLASANVMASQWAAAEGWDARLAEKNGAVLVAGAENGREISGMLTLTIVSATLEKALASLPANIQTIGHALQNPRDKKWMECVSRSRIKRFVPLASMHHFGPVWDGQPFWRQGFEMVEIG